MHILFDDYLMIYLTPIILIFSIMKTKYEYLVHYRQIIEHVESIII